MSEFERVRGFRRDSELIWVPAHKFLYVKNVTRRGFEEFVCYQTVICDPKKKHNNGDRCTRRVKINLETKKMVCKDMMPHDHPSHETLFKDMQSKNKITDDCIAIGQTFKGLAIKVPISDIFTREMSK